MERSKPVLNINKIKCPHCEEEFEHQYTTWNGSHVNVHNVLCPFCQKAVELTPVMTKEEELEMFKADKGGTFRNDELTEGELSD